jgi:photosystem II stability/assembly factor-like uncharacterized protein
VTRRGTPFLLFLPMLVLALAVLVVGGGVGHAATAPVTVSMSVPSAVTLTNQCATTASYDLGVTLPGAPALTSTTTPCRIAFSSSNDSAMLRVAQKDGTGTAMTSATMTGAVKMAPATRFEAISAVAATPSTAWAVGAGSSPIAKTVNSGATWTNQAAGCPGINTMYDVSTVSTTVAWAVGSNGVICRTTDGTNWSATATLPTGGAAINYGGVVATSSTAATVAGSGGVIASTTDGGTTWTMATGTLATSDFFNIAKFGTTMFAIDAAAGIWKSTNSGASWVVSTASGGCYNPRGLWMFDASNVYVSGDGDCIMRTTNGGTSWTSPTSISNGNYIIRDVYGVTATDVWAAANDGRLLHTTDGTNWVEVQTSTTESFQALWLSATVNYAVGAGLATVTSPDRTTWTLLAGSTPGWSIAGVSAQVAWVAGQSGTIKATTDGGTTWATQATPVTTALRSIDAYDSQRAIAVGDGGVIVWTTNGGTTWSQASPPTTQNLWAVSMADDRTAFAVGLGGVVLATHDSGATWTTIASGGVDLFSVSAPDDQTIWVGGDSGTVRKSLNGGATWTTLTSGLTKRANAVSALDANYAWIGGGYNVVRATTDGTNFANVNTGFNVWIWSLSVASRSVTFGGGGNVRRTQDGGLSAASVTGLSSSTAGDAVDAVDANTVWVAFDGGTVSRGVSSGTAVGDYAGGNAWATAGTPSLFGACLQATSNVTVNNPTWVADTVTTPGTCQSTDADPWEGVPAAMSKVAQTAGPGINGSVDFVWGARPATNQPAGTYRATVLFEALAPAV